MRTRPFGNTGLHVAEVGMDATAQPKHMPESHWIDLVREAVDLGVTIFDTAEAYQQGGSEDILGKALGNADGIYSLWKLRELGCGFFVSSDHGLRSKSKRLRRDCIDVYQLHSPSREKWNSVTGALRCSNCGKPGRSRCAAAVSSAADGIWLIEQGLVGRCRS